MAGLPHLQQTRSLSRYGLSQVTVIFEDGTDIYFARQLVNQRIQEATRKIAAGLTPTMGPISTGLGEIYMWTVEAKDGARKPDGTALHADRLARDSGLDHQTTAAQRARGYRNQHHRWLRQRVPGGPQPGKAGFTTG
jgi:Cu/Ag efflux pump CusA